MTNRRALQAMLMLMIFISTSMLAISVNHYYLIPVAFVATVGSFWLTDHLRWISIEGWMANVASLAILVYSLFEFYPADSSGKLIAVAKLLVYLQAVLVFQFKTPRLNWQIMVLSLLQVVITTIFSFQFEGGFLFALFFLVGGATLVLQNRFNSEYTIEQSNKSSLESKRRIAVENTKARKLAWWRYESRAIPEVTSLESLKKFTLRPLLILPGVALIAAMFTTVVFLTAPRHVQPWFSPITYKVNSTGISKKVSLEETGKISGSTRRVFEAKFYPTDGSSPDPIHLNQPPYFRGIALSNLTYEDGKTRWNAAYERVHSNTYQTLQNYYPTNDTRLTVMSVTMERTTEPLLYTVMPAGLSENTIGKIKFCHEISAITRCRENEEIDYAPFKYELTVPLTQTNSPAVAWPYAANRANYSNAPMADDPSQQRWLTRIDRKYYPTLVKIADDIAARVEQSGGGRFELVKAMENHFLDSNNYTYTLDYTDVDRNLNIDPNEDFVANFKTGHCEAYASAMTLMLRSQGIPARMVTGFYGGEYRETKRSYVVRGRHAHAWVEVYMRRRDCRLAKLERWQYREGGAWMIADPTPPQPDVGDVGAENAIELARTVWQDYVLGMESNEDTRDKSSFVAAIAEFLDDFDFRDISDKLSESRNRGWLAILQPLFVVVLIVAGLIGMLRILIINAGYEEKKPTTAVGKIKRFVADAIGLISADLREWVIGHNSETAFYKRLSDILGKHDLAREPNQTHREFAEEASSKFSSHPSSGLISKVLHDVTEAFNRVRFGLQELPPDEHQRIDESLVELEKALKEA